MSNVLDWKTALDNGHEPRQYPYAAEEVPMGQYKARLDFKIWARLEFTISCYFTAVDTGKKFQLSVFRRKSDEVYGLVGGQLNFKECPTETDYLITVGTSSTGKAMLEKAELAGD